MHLVPVHSVHILEVETVAIGTPRLIVDLLPLLGIVDVHCEIVEIHKIFGRSLVGREIHHVELASRSEESRLLAIGSHSKEPFAKRFVFLLVEVEHRDGKSVVIPQLLAVAIEVAIVSARKWQLDDAVADSVDVDNGDILIGSSLLGFLVGLLFVVLLGLVGLGCFHFHFVVFLNEWRRGALGEQGDIHALHIGVGVVPLGVAVDGIEVACRSKDKIFAVGAECRCR